MWGNGFGIGYRIREYVNRGVLVEIPIEDPAWFIAPIGMVARESDPTRIRG